MAINPIPMPASNPAPAPAVELKAGTALLFGEPGTGKTHSLITLLEAGLEVFDIVTEPGGLVTIMEQIRKHPRSADFINKFHYTQISPVPIGWSALKDMGNIVNRMGYEDIAKLKTGIGKQHMDVFTKLLADMENFTCDHCMRAFGDVTTWDDSRALVLDSVSGLNKIMKDQTVGYKPSLHQGEWGIAMKLEEEFIYQLCSSCKCFFICLGHADKVTNEVTGARDITLAALGNKLAPQLIKLFDEVLLSKKEGANFYWSNVELGTTTKTRSLPFSAKLPPSFVPLVTAHAERKKLLPI
jgi:hypothetical protein